jgi:hypothetical protein
MHIPSVRSTPEPLRVSLESRSSVSVTRARQEGVAFTGRRFSPDGFFDGAAVDLLVGTPRGRIC